RGEISTIAIKLNSPKKSWSPAISAIREAS
ncbi:unnamed protein product, partial [marine sediment metagenome]